MSVTEEEANALVALPKSIGEPIKWKPVPRARGRFRFAVRVFSAQSEEILILTGTASLHSWSFVLLGPGNSRLRRISKPKHPHTNDDGTVVKPKHKHTWSEHGEDRDAYLPSDIQWHNFNAALLDFVKECNISLLHEYPDLYLQGGL